MKRFFILLVTMLPVFAQAATVTSQLSAGETAVGIPVQLEVRIDGTTNAILPRDLEIDGLETIQTNKSTQVQIINGQISTNAVFRYTLMPMKEGDFEIPPFDVTVDGKRESTQPHRLRVAQGSLPAPRPAPPSPGQRAQPQRPPDPGAEAKGPIAFAEVIVPKKSVYAGELVPVDIRFYFNERFSFSRTNQEPQFSGEGFTVAKLVPGARSEQVIDDVGYFVLTYKTAITAVKSGELEIPAVSFPVVVEVPSNAQDGFEDMFSQFFGGRMPGMFTQTRELLVTSEPFSIEVKPLPRGGRPEGFAGAIGEFTIAASADPTKAGPGDPITLSLAISGQGNFDTLTEPKLFETDGWRAYPPTERFEQDDEVGYSGTKTFDQPVVAQAPQTQTPVAEFSFFDPVQEKYVTVRTEPVTVEAEASDSTPPAVAAVESEGTPQAEPTPEEKAGWIANMRPQSFDPVLTRPAFWIANGLAALIAVGAIAAAVVRRAKSGPAARRKTLVRRRDHLLRGLESLSDEDFYARAVEVLSVQAEIEGGGGAFEWVRRGAANRSAEVNDELESVLARADERKFSGGVALAVDAEKRPRAVAALREACK